MTYSNLLEDFKSCQKKYKALSKIEREREEGVVLFDKIFEIQDQLKEIESSLSPFHSPIGNYKEGIL